MPDKNYIDKEYLDEFLDDQEQAQISQFVMNDKMREAVKKVLLFSLYNCGTIKKGKSHRPNINFALVFASQKGAKNEEIGADVKACWEGINLLANAFRDIEMYKLEKMPELKSNPAR